MISIKYFLLCYFFVNTLGQYPGCPENVQTIPEFDGNKVLPIILKSVLGNLGAQSFTSLNADICALMEHFLKGIAP